MPFGSDVPDSNIGNKGARQTKPNCRSELVDEITPYGWGQS